ncbi:MAG: PAAR domain-containing protein [Polyangiaceae bacterium]|nr:PAAR domain-containing protein [Polyangiaceae bacterium]
MDKPGAKQGDKVVAVDTHIVLVPSPAGPVPTPMPLPFQGSLVDALSADVQIEDKAAAVKGSKAKNAPAHVPAGGPFQRPPSNEATIQTGSGTVLVNDKPAARSGDTALTCNDPADAPQGSVIAGGTVLIGG